MESLGPKKLKIMRSAGVYVTRINQETNSNGSTNGVMCIDTGIGSVAAYVNESALKCTCESNYAKQSCQT